MIIVREILGLAETSREATSAISKGLVMVDGEPQRNHKFPVGSMDVVRIPRLDQSFRMIPVSGKRLAPLSIGQQEASFKLCRIVGKRVVNGGKLQLNLHDGRSLRYQDSQLDFAEKQTLGSVVQITLPDQKPIRYLPIRKGAYGLITAGANVGFHGRIISIEGDKSKARLVAIEDIRGKQVRTIPQYLFVVGEEKPLITLPEVARE